MTGSNVQQRYPPLSIFLHWAMFLLIAGAYSCILLREYFPRGSDIREGLKAWHFMLGLTILLLFFIRVVARFLTAKPPITPALAAAPVEGRAPRALRFHAGDAAAGLDHS